MRFSRRLAWGSIIAVLTAMLVVGCGGRSSSTDDSTPTPTSDSSSSTTSKSTESKGSALEPSKEFLSGGKNGQLATIGEESSLVEREAASLALEQSLDARAAGDWAAQCETLASATVEQIEKSASLGGSGGPGCAKALEAQARGLPPFARANTMTGPIDAFRINQDINGFAFYHGTRSRDFVIPLIMQRGEWKVVAPQEEEIR